MKAINKKARVVMAALTEDIEGTNSHRTVDTAKGAFMPVHVEHVNNCELGRIYSVAHYYEQNSDLMRDPDMEFIKGGDGEYYPISFWQDAPLVRDEPMEWADGEIVGFNAKRQAALATFANTWMRNIKEQQGL